MKFYTGLTEKRRNPEMNPKIGVVQALEQYKDRDDVFIQFSDIKKLGMNPKSEGHTTPLGIYTYPLKDIGYEQFVHNKIPFGGDRKYIIVCSSNLPNMLHVKSYNSSMFNSDLEFYRKNIYYKYAKYITGRPNSTTAELDKVFDGIMKMATDKIKVGNYFEKIFGFLDITAEALAGMKVPGGSKVVMRNGTKLFTMRGYEGIVDSGTGSVYFNEKWQVAFFSTKSLKIIDLIPNKRYDNIMEFDTFEDLIKTAKGIDTEDSEIYNVGKTLLIQSGKLYLRRGYKNFDYPMMFNIRLSDKANRTEFLKDYISGSVSMMSITGNSLEKSGNISTLFIYPTLEPIMQKMKIGKSDFSALVSHMMKTFPYYFSIYNGNSKFEKFIIEKIGIDKFQELKRKYVDKPK